MKILKIIGVIILILILAVAIAGIFAPKEYNVERSVVIESPVEYAFYYTHYLSNFSKWEPWGKKDSTMKSWVEGKDGEVGAVYKWEGDPKLTGKGEMKITELDKNKRIAYWMKFYEPMEDEAGVYMNFADKDGKTEIVWGFDGKSPFPWNVMLLFMDMDQMLGTDFEQGLSNLKAQIESNYQKAMKYTIKEEMFKGKMYVAIKSKVNMQKIADFFTENFGTVGMIAKKNRARIMGAPTGLYFSWDEQTMETEMAAAMPVNKVIKTDEAEMIEIPAGKALVIDYYGPYEQSGNAHWAMDYYFYLHNLKHKPPVIEEYITDPGKEPDPNKWLTRIIYLVE
ncbi:MAG: hypothetical protein Kow00108_17300 [Calditrichia bacterium]